MALVYKHSVVDQPILLAFSTTALLANAEVYDSGYQYIGDRTQVSTSLLSDKNGTLVIDFCSNAGDNDDGVTNVDVIRTLTVAYTSASGFQQYNAPTFGKWVRYRFTCDEAGQADFYMDTKLLQTAISSQQTVANGFISPTMMATLSRSILVGVDEDGAYTNVGTSAGGAMKTTSAIPSDGPGRTAVSVIVDSTASELLYTVPGGKVFNVTDVILYVQNAATNAEGVYHLRNGTLITDAISLSMLIPEAATSETAVSKLNHSFLEPIQFVGGIYGEENLGTLHVVGRFSGYLDDV